MTSVSSDIPTIPTKTAPVALIGFGVAGFNAAVGLRSAGYQGPIEVFSSGGALPWSPILTSYYAARTVNYEDCFPWSQEEIDQLDLTIHTFSPVVALDTNTHTIKTAQEDYRYSKCIIAVGASPIVFGFEETTGYYPFILHSMEEAERLRAILMDPACQKILVSGASMIAVKMLEASLQTGKDCTLVGMNDHILDMTAFPETAARFERNLVQQGVHFRFNQTIVGTTSHPAEGHPQDRILEVLFSNGETDTFDEIFAAHGMRSDLSFIDPDAITIDQGILVDEYMRTSDPDVYAAGDVAQALELISGTAQIVGIWKNAAIQGMCAGKAVAHELAGDTPAPKDAFAGSIASNTISCNGPLFLSAGTCMLTERRHTEIVESEDMTVVYLFENDRLVGFNICADEDIEGGTAYELGGMLTRRILSECSA